MCCFPQPNLAEAVRWYKAAGDLPQALFSLGWMTARGQGGLSKNRDVAMEFFQRANKKDSRMRIPSAAEVREAGGTGGLFGIGVDALPVAGAAAGALVVGVAWYIHTLRKGR